MYALQQLETFLSEKNKPNPEKVKEEQQKIEQAMLDYLYSDRSSEKIKMYVTQHAKGLMEIIESEKNKKKPEIINVPQELMLFLEKHGAGYWKNNWSYLNLLNNRSLK
jgi:hypothetical protein